MCGPRSTRQVPAGRSTRLRGVRAAAVGADAVRADWRERARPIAPGKPYPAKEYCSNCGLCDSYYIAHVKDACAFLGDGAALY